LASYRAMGYDAINLGQNDLLLGIPLLLQKAKDANLPFVSSNLLDKKSLKPLFNPLIIKEIGGLTVGIFGLMAESDIERKTDSYLIKDAYETAKEMLKTLEGKVELIIVLSTLSREKNDGLLQQFPDIDFVIGTVRSGSAPVRVNGSYILFSGFRGQHVGILGIDLASQKRPLAIRDMDEGPTLRSNLNSTKKQIERLEKTKEDFSKSDTAQVSDQLNQHMALLKQREGKYRKELTLLGDVRNRFSNRMIPLGGNPPEPGVATSRKDKEMAEKAPSATAPGPHIKALTTFDDNGKKITFAVLIHKAPNQVRSLGFDVSYDPQRLRYLGYAKGNLVNGFDMFDASSLKGGIVRVGGFDAGKDIIDAGKGGELARLDFEVTGKHRPELHIGGLKDDISSWKVEIQESEARK